MRPDRCGQIVPKTPCLQKVACVAPRAQRGDRRARGDGPQVVADHVRQDEAGDRGRGRKAQHAAALQPRKLLPDQVDLGDLEAIGQKKPVDGGLVLQCQARGRCGQKGRAAAGNQGDDPVTFASAIKQVGHRLSGFRAVLVRHRMARGHDPGPGNVAGVFVIGDHQCPDRSIPQDGQSSLNHGHRSLADCDQDIASPGVRWGNRLRGECAPKRPGGVGSGDRNLEQPEGLGAQIHHAPAIWRALATSTSAWRIEA